MLVLPTTYFGPISYYAALYHAPEVMIEAQEHYMKQTLRNRCVIATDQGPQTLSVNVEKGNKLKMPIREIRLSGHNDWPRLHLHALATYYGQSPFFEYYIDDLREVFMHGHDGTLFGMNEALRRHICSEIGFTPRVQYSEEWQGPLSDAQPFLSSASASADEAQALLRDTTYYQIATVSGRQPFMADMSILDLLFNMGPEAILVLDKLKF